jgi:hypothetical protein
MLTMTLESTTLTPRAQSSKSAKKSSPNSSNAPTSSSARSYSASTSSQEDHGKAILVFTIASVIFLPLSFVSSYLGMNTVDIRDMELNQALFWQVALPATFALVALVLTGAYNASRILGWVSKRGEIVIISSPCYHLLMIHFPEGCVTRAADNSR